MSKQQVLEAIKKHKTFLIAAHINPEGDSIASQLALQRLLSAMGKEAHIVNADKVPANLLFLPHVDTIKTMPDISDEHRDFEAAVIIDCPNKDRTGSVQELLDGKYIINIDHHISNKNFGDANWVETEFSSAGEMIYDLFKACGAEIDAETALELYVAIMTDTGSFRYANTSPKTHEIASELLRFNLDPAHIYQAIYESKPFEVFKLLALALKNLKRSPDGKYVWFYVTFDMLKENHLKPENTEDFIALVRMIEGAEVVGFLRELESANAVKVSLRSKSNIDVNKIAKVFGGGGHPAASGCLIEKKVSEAEKLLYEAVLKAIDNKEK